MSLCLESGVWPKCSGSEQKYKKRVCQKAVLEFLNMVFDPYSALKRLYLLEVIS